ncbi:MAG: TonB-dependent receptor [Candidatus Handelsmanbacteria bacterium]|nr:TonB-dependent receptor [Candidatus Handelsmanbacteria bacterium]
MVARFAAAGWALLGLLPLSHPVQAETLHGRVVDATTGQPLAGVVVMAPQIRVGITTGEDGGFDLVVPGSVRGPLEFRLLGYEVATLPALASEANPPVVVRLVPAPIAVAEVEVQGSRDRRWDRAQGSALLSESQIRDRQGQTLGETLTQVPGLALLKTGPAIAKPVIRGLHSDRVLVLNQGLAQEGQQWGAEHAPEIDPFATGGVEVLKGAAGVEYGTGAIGGVVRVVPPRFRRTPGLGGRLALNGFGNNRQGAGALLVEGMAERLPGLSWRLQTSLRRAGNSRTTAYYLSNTGFSERNVSAALAYHRGTGAVELHLSHFGTALGIFRGSHIGNRDDLLRAIARGRPLAEGVFSYEVLNPRQQIAHDLVAAKVRHPLAGLGRLEVQYGWQQNHRSEYDAHRPYNDSLAALARPTFDLALTTRTLETRLEGVGGSAATLGANLMRQGNVRQGSVFLIPNFRARSGGVFARQIWYLRGLKLDTGLRFDQRRVQTYVRQRDGQVLARRHCYAGLSGAVGLIGGLGPAWTSGVTLGTAWRPPNVNELYSRDVHHGAGQYEIGDLGLGEERSLSLDWTLKHQGRRTQGELSLYRNRMDGFIFLQADPQPTVTTRGTFPTFRYVQSAALIRGIEAWLEYRPLVRGRLGVSATLVRGRDLSRGQALGAMPADRTRLWAGVGWPDAGWCRELNLELSLEAVARQQRAPAADYAPPPGGYLLLGVRLGGRSRWRGQILAWSVELENLADGLYRDYLSRYRYFAHDPGRNLTLRLELPFGRESEATK